MCSILLVGYVEVATLVILPLNVFGRRGMYVCVQKEHFPFVPWSLLIILSSLLCSTFYPPQGFCSHLSGLEPWFFVLTGNINL